MDLESLAIWISRNENLPMLPEVATAALRLTDDPTASARSLETIIEADSAVTAKMLRVANSAYYGGREVSSITRAVTMLGLDTVRSLILAISYQHLLSGDFGCRLFSKVDFWRHSLAVATASRILGKIKLPSRADELYSIGMIHDVGMLVFERFCPREFDYAIEYARRNGIPVHQAEKRVFGTDHAEVGGLLASKWNLSPAMQAAIEFHHDPSEAEAEKETTSIIALSDTIAYRCGMGNNVASEREFDEECMEVLNIPEEQLQIIINVVLGEVASAEVAFHVQAA